MDTCIYAHAYTLLHIQYVLFLVRIARKRKQQGFSDFVYELSGSLAKIQFLVQ